MTEAMTPIKPTVRGFIGRNCRSPAAKRACAAKQVSCSALLLPNQLPGASRDRITHCKNQHGKVGINMPSEGQALPVFY